MPVLATQYYGKGQVLFLAADEVWRWRFNTGDKLYARFWGQVVYTLGLPHLLGHGQRVQLALDRAEAIVGRPGYIYARLFDAEYKPYVAERVPATLESIDAGQGETRSKPLMLEPVPGRPGEYRALLPHDSAGRFELRLTQPEPGNFAFRVQLPPAMSWSQTPWLMAPARACPSNRRCFLPRRGLVRAPGRTCAKEGTVHRRQEVLLWNPLAFVLFVGW